MGMNIFKPVTFRWWQMGLFKISLISLGIILGVYYQAFFLQYIVLVTIVFIVPAVYLLTVWWNQP